MIFLIPLFALDGYGLIFLIIKKRYGLAAKYFFISRIILAIWLIYFYYHYFSTYTSQSGASVTPLILLLLAVIVATSISGFLAGISRVLALLTVTITLFGFCALIFMQVTMGPNVQHSSFAIAQTVINNRHDLQVSSDLTDLATCLQQEGVLNNALPPTLESSIKQCDNTGGVNNDIGRLNQYNYKILVNGQNGSFQLCAKFNTVKHGPNSTGQYIADSHGKGLQCFKYSVSGG